MVIYQKKRRTDLNVTPPEADAASAYGDKVIVKFVDAENTDVGDELELPITTSSADLKAILKTYLPPEEGSDDFALVLGDYGIEIQNSISSAFRSAEEKGLPVSTENTLSISFFSKVPFKIRPITSLTGSLEGHNGTILCSAFNSTSTLLATGGGDSTVRIWNISTKTPLTSLVGHTGPVVSLAWSADGKWLATGSEDSSIRLWNMQRVTSTSKPESFVLKGHKQPITTLDFMPIHLYKHWQGGCPLLLSGCRDGSVIVWDTANRVQLKQLSGHSKMITTVKWSGVTDFFKSSDCAAPYAYTASRDMTVKLWDVMRATPVINVRCHGHWVNSLSLNTQGIMRQGCADIYGKVEAGQSLEEMGVKAEQTFSRAMKAIGDELAVTCSDDNTLCLWNLFKALQRGEIERIGPVARMTGHQKTVCSALFSPNGQFIVSAGFDSAIRLWEGRTGKFLHTFRGHVGPVYQLSWAPDSRLFVSCSKDSTLKLWDSSEGSRKLKVDLPGAADEIYTVEWSIDGACVASGGKDKIVRLWSQ